MTDSDYLIHDRIYRDIKIKGMTGWGGDARMAKYEETLKRFHGYSKVPTQGYVLDLGCGEGVYSRALNKLGYQVTGIDVSTAAIEWAREKTGNANIEYQCVDLSSDISSLEGRQYNIVFDGQCLHCIVGGDRSTVFERLNQLLKPNGILFLSSLCSKTDSFQVIEKEGVAYRHVGTAASIKMELEAAGFKLVHEALFPNSEFDHICLHAEKR